MRTVLTSGAGLIGVLLSSLVAFFAMAWEQYRSPGGKSHSINGGTIASAATLPTPRGFINHVSGTTQTTLIPLPYADFEGLLVFIPSGAWTGATGGTPTATNRALAAAFTAAANQPVFAIYSKVSGLWTCICPETNT